MQGSGLTNVVSFFSYLAFSPERGNCGNNNFVFFPFWTVIKVHDVANSFFLLTRITCHNKLVLGNIRVRVSEISLWSLPIYHKKVQNPYKGGGAMMILKAALPV